MSGNTGFGEVIELFGEEETVLKVLLELVVAGLGGVNIFGDWIRPGGGFLIFGTFSANISKPKRVPELVLIDFLSFSLTLASASAILCLFFSDFSVGAVLAFNSSLARSSLSTSWHAGPWPLEFFPQ